MRFKALVTLGVVLTSCVLSLGQSAKIKVLHNFGSTGDGSIPYGPLLLDPKGNLYGVTTDGGTGQCSDYGCGTAYKLTPASVGGWHENILHSFGGGSDGSGPWGALAFDSHGNLYGTLHGQSGVDASGVFELTPSSTGWSNTFVYNVYSGPGLVLDNLGNIYGAIGAGDYFGIGAIGELTPSASGWNYTQLYSFCPGGDCSGGYNPAAAPIWDAKGNLWSTMISGGITQSPCVSVDGCGVVYEMTPNGDGTWTYNVIHQFASSSTDGQFPGGGLVMDSSGNFYGSTTEGGTSNLGTIFKFSNIGGTWQEKIIYEFSSCKLGWRVAHALGCRLRFQQSGCPALAIFCARAGTMLPRTKGLG